MSTRPSSVGEHRRTDSRSGRPYSCRCERTRQG